MRRALRDGDTAVRVAAAEALSRIEHRPAEALPILVEGYRQQHGYAWGALGRYGSAAAGPVLAIVVDEDFDPIPSADTDRSDAAGQVHQYLSQLTRERQSPFELRLEALRHLGDLEPEPEAAVPRLIAMLEADRPALPPGPVYFENRRLELQGEVILALGRFGPEARAAVPALIRCLRSRQTALHAPAAWALARIGPAAADAVPALRDALREPEPLSEHALARLGLGGWQFRCGIVSRWSSEGRSRGLTGPAYPWDFGGVESGAGLMLWEQLHGGESLGRVEDGRFSGFEHGGVRAQAAHALSRIGLAARQAVPDLREALRHPANDSVVMAAALWELTGRAEEVVPVLVDRLRETDGRDEEAFALLARLGPAARTAVPELMRVLKEAKADWWDVPRTALTAEVLGRIGPDARVAVPDLERALWSANVPLRGAALMALWRIDGRAADAVRGLVPLTRWDLPAELPAAGTRLETLVRAAAVRALGRIGPPARDALPLLRQLLSAKDVHLRIAAAEAFGRVRGDFAEALPVLSRALRDDDPEARQAAATTLGLLGSQARPVVPALRAALEDPEPAVRRAAKEALKAVEGGMILPRPG